MRKTLRELYDLVVVGGGPAGAAAALRASQREATVLVVEQEKFPRAHVSTEWLGPAGVNLCKKCGVSVRKAGAAEFKGIRLHSWDLKRSRCVDDAELRGWLVDRATFDQALLSEASRAGAEALLGVVVQDLNLGEERAVLRLSDGRDVAGRVVLIADGVASPTGQMANLTCAAQQPDVPQCASAQCQAGE
ncbi:MAG: NAD(P)/FAD-dependent oxidoreductase, partial [Phycisphaerae bacterium]